MGSTADRVKEMTDFRRGMIFKVMDDDQRVLPIMHALTFWVLCDQMLMWLHVNMLTGKNLHSWFNIQWEGTRMLDMCKFIEMKVLGLDRPRPTIRGKNWIG